MDDEHCESKVYGLYISDKSQHVDNFSFIDHAKPNCYSEELFKGVLDDTGHSSVCGKNHGSPGRSENKRIPEKRQSVAHGNRKNKHQTDVGDLCRRRKMFARRHGWPTG